VGRILAVANQKGGVGKTTTVVNLATCLAELGRRVLIVDMDPQANATSAVGRRGTPGRVYPLLLGAEDSPEAGAGCVSTGVEGLFLLAASVELAGAEVELAALSDRERRLRRVLVPWRDAYDYIFVDCPPSLGLLTVNALVAADGVVVPVQCEYFALEGLGQLVSTIDQVRRGLNPALGLEGVVLTMFDGRTNLALQVVDEVKRHFRQRVYGVLVPRLVRLSEAPSHGLPITRYDPRSRAAQVYRDLAVEVMERAEGSGARARA
jgi:chromosome partitioning protein